MIGTATEFDVLMCLVSERGRALSREDIFRRVWGPNHHGTPRTVDNFIQQLRAKLEADSQELKLVEAQDFYANPQLQFEVEALEPFSGMPMCPPFWGGFWRFRG